MDGCIGMGIDDLIGEGEWNGAEPRVSANKLGGKTCMVTPYHDPRSRQTTGRYCGLARAYTSNFFTFRYTST